MNRAIIFDFDGVIINSVEVQRKAFTMSYNKIVGEGTPPFEEFLNHSGNSIQNIFKLMGLPLEMVNPYWEISKKNIGSIKVYDGMKQLIEGIRMHGYKCGLCTGKDRSRTIEILKNIDLYDSFEAIICSDDVVNPKPHYESYLLLARKLNVDVKNTIMVGDSRNDIICARGAGADCIAVSWGDVKKEVLEKEFPKHIVENTEQLYSCIIEHFNIGSKLNLKDNISKYKKINSNEYLGEYLTSVEN